MKTKCGRCGKKHKEVNPKTGEPFYRCSKCRKARTDRQDARKASGQCRDCPNEAFGKTRCIKCVRAIKASLKARGRCGSCGGEKNTTASVCSRCVLKGIARKAVGDSSRWIELRDLLTHQGSACAITGVPIEIGTNASIDHIVPKNRGGSDDITNLRWLHIVVNRMKNDHLDSELLEWVQLIVRNQKRLDTKTTGKTTTRRRMWPSGGPT